MGATCSGGSLPDSSLKYMQLLKESEYLAIQTCQKHNLPQKSQSIITRIVQSKQSHLLIALQLLTSRNQRLLFLEKLEYVNLELLDSLYFNLIQERSLKDHIYNVEPYTQITLLGQDIPIQKYKEIGIDYIRKSKGTSTEIQLVAILIMAGGLSSSFGHPLRELEPINILPSKKCLLELQMDRCQSIAELMDVQIQVILMLSNAKDELRQFINKREYKNLGITFIYQFQLGVLNQNGKVVLESSKSFSMFPNGTGDILSSLNEKKVLQRLRQSKIQYLSVCSSNNLMESMIDPTVVGYIVNKKLDIVGKCVNQQYSSGELSKILSINQKIYITDQRQISVHLSTNPEIVDIKMYQNAKAFTNSALLKIDFLLSVLNSQNQNYSFGRSYRTKQISIQSFDTHLQVMNKQRGYLFQKDFTDLFWCTKNFQIIEIQGDRYFPIISKTGVYSLENGAKVLSQEHKKWLGLNNQNTQDICQINPQISVWGQNLEQVASELKECQVEYPLYIYNI